MDDLVSKYGKKEEKSLDTNGVVNIFDKYFPGLLLTDCLNESMMMDEITEIDNRGAMIISICQEACESRGKTEKG